MVSDISLHFAPELINKRFFSSQVMMIVVMALTSPQITARVKEKHASEIYTHAKMATAFVSSAQVYN